MNNDFKAGIIGGLVFLGILLCLGLVENTLESSSDKKASPYSRYSYTPNYGTSKRSSYSSRSSTSGKSSSTTSSTKYSGTKSTSRIIIIHMMMAMIQSMMMVIMMITDMTGIQTMLMV